MSLTTRPRTDYGTCVEIDEEKLEAILARLDRSQAWVARQLGLNRSTFHHYVRGRRAFPQTLYPRMVALLGTTDFVKAPSAV